MNSTSGIVSRSFSSQPVDRDNNDWNNDTGFSSSPPASAAESSPVESGLDLQAIADAIGAAEIDSIVAAGEAGWAPTRVIIHSLSSFHDTLGAGWIAAIVATTIAARFFLFPVVVYQMQNTAKMSAARPEMEQLTKWMKEQQSRGNENATKEYQQRLALVWSKHGVNPLKSMAGIAFQAPLFICFFSGLRHMATAKVPSMVAGGMYWFPDLTVADPYYGLPLLCSASFLATVELGAADGMQGMPPESLSRMKTFFRFIAVAMIPLSSGMPASVFVYWITSNIFSLGQTAVLKSPTVRKLLNLPQLTKSTPVSGGAVTQPTFHSKSPFKTKLDAAAPFKQYQQQQLQQEQPNSSPTAFQTDGQHSQPVKPFTATKQSTPKQRPVRRHIKPTFSSTEPDANTYDVQPTSTPPSRKGHKGSRFNRK